MQYIFGKVADHFFSGLCLTERNAAVTWRPLTGGYGEGGEGGAGG